MEEKDFTLILVWQLSYTSFIDLFSCFEDLLFSFHRFMSSTIIQMTAKWSKKQFMLLKVTLACYLGRFDGSVDRISDLAFNKITLSNFKCFTLDVFISMPHKVCSL